MKWCVIQTFILKEIFLHHCNHLLHHRLSVKSLTFGSYVKRQYSPNNEPSSSKDINGRSEFCELQHVVKRKRGLWSGCKAFILFNKIKNKTNGRLRILFWQHISPSCMRNCRMQPFIFWPGDTTDGEWKVLQSEQNPALDCHWWKVFTLEDGTSICEWWLSDFFLFHIPFQLQIITMAKRL